MRISCSSAGNTQHTHKVQGSHATSCACGILLPKSLLTLGAVIIPSERTNAPKTRNHRASSSTPPKRRPTHTHAHQHQQTPHQPQSRLHQLRSRNCFLEIVLPSSSCQKLARSQRTWSLALVLPLPAPPRSSPPRPPPPPPVDVDMLVAYYCQMSKIQRRQKKLFPLTELAKQRWK